MAQASHTPDRSALAGLRVALVGKLASMPRRDAQQHIRAQGGVAVEMVDDATDLVVLAEQTPPFALRDVLDADALRALDEGRLVAINETQLWQRLGLVESDQDVRRMYTPAMLAELVGTPVATVRRWHRRGLLTAQRQVGRLAYFDFAAVATARQLAALAAAGVSPRQIEKQFASLARWFGEACGGGDAATLLVEGRRLMVRESRGLLEPSGQKQLEFDADDAMPASVQAEPRAADDLSSVRDQASGDPAHNAARPAIAEEIAGAAHAARSAGEDAPLATPAEMLDAALSLEDAGQLELAAEMYRAALAAVGPRAEVCFALADVLYRLGDVAGARERYYMAIELDENFVEARANLGCVLAETGQLDLAVSAFQGALAYHRDFPDAHYHLALALDELGRDGEAATHWRAFLELAPDSPWAVTARERLAN